MTEQLKPISRKKIWEPHKVREQDLTLERTAANANLRIVQGYNEIFNPEEEKKPFRQPFWFVYEWGEMTGVYVAAQGSKYRDNDGKLKMFFAVNEAREKLRQLLINYYATGQAMGMSIIEFGGSRGFRLKTSRAQ